MNAEFSMFSIWMCVEPPGADGADSAFVSAFGIGSRLHPSSRRSPCSVLMVCMYSPTELGSSSTRVPRHFTPDEINTFAPGAKRFFLVLPNEVVFGRGITIDIRGLMCSV